MFFSIRINYNKSPRTRGRLSATEDPDNFHIFSADGSIDVKLSRRNTYPKTYCVQTTADNWELGYGLRHANGDDEEFLRIAINSSGQLHIVRDTYATLPIFYGSDDSSVFVSNLYEAVTDALPRLTLDHRGLAEILMPHIALHPMLWEEIGGLEEREVLDVNSHGELKIVYPKPRPWTLSSELPASDPTEFIPRLEQVLQGTLKRYSTSSDMIAFELSGGLDSSLLPLYLSKNDPSRPWYGVTILVSGRYETTLSAKLAAIQKLAPNAQLDVLRPKKHHLPLTKILSSPEAFLFYPKRDIYYEILESMDDAFQARHATTVFTGVGGDEVFEHIVNKNAYAGAGEDGFLERMKYFASFYTDTLRSLVNSTTQKDSDHRPISLLSTSVAEPRMHSNAYIERGIWPVSPFINVSFFNYCQALPWNLKKDKRLLRAYYQANHFPGLIHDKTLPNEDFSDYFNSALLSPYYAPFIEYFAQEGVTVEMGYVDGKKLLQSYRQMLTADHLPKENELFQVYLWLCVEINLHTALRSGQWR